MGQYPEAADSPSSPPSAPVRMTARGLLRLLLGRHTPDEIAQAAEWAFDGRTYAEIAGPRRVDRSTVCRVLAAVNATLDRHGLPRLRQFVPHAGKTRQISPALMRSL